MCRICLSRANKRGTQREFPVVFQINFAGGNCSWVHASVTSLYNPRYYRNTAPKAMRGEAGLSKAPHWYLRKRTYCPQQIPHNYPSSTLLPNNMSLQGRPPGCSIAGNRYNALAASDALLLLVNEHWRAVLWGKKWTNWTSLWTYPVGSVRCAQPIATSSILPPQNKQGVRHPSIF